MTPSGSSIPLPSCCERPVPSPSPAPAWPQPGPSSLWPVRPCRLQTTSPIMLDTNTVLDDSRNAMHYPYHAREHFCSHFPSDLPSLQVGLHHTVAAHHPSGEPCALMQSEVSHGGGGRTWATYLGRWRPPPRPLQTSTDHGSCSVKGPEAAESLELDLVAISGHEPPPNPPTPKDLPTPQP